MGGWYMDCRAHWAPLSLFFPSPSVLRSQFWFIRVWSEFLSGMCVMFSNSLHSHKYFLSLGVNGSLAGWRTLGLQSFSLRLLSDVFPQSTRPRGADEKPILFHMRITCSFCLEAFEILSLTLEFRNSTRICLGMCFVHQPYVNLGEAFPSTDAGFSLGKCSFFV